MISRAAGEAMAFDHTLEAFALADTADLDLVAGFERFHGDRFAHGQIVLPRHLNEVALGGDTRLLQVAKKGLVQPLGLAVAEGDLSGGITILLDRLLLRDETGPGFDRRAPDDRPVGLEVLGHPQFCA